jgi:hypothetical protein
MALTKPDETVYVIGTHEYPDTQIYAHRRFQFVASIDQALSESSLASAYCIVRGDELAQFAAQSTANVEEVFRFERAKKDSVIIFAKKAGA